MHSTTLLAVLGAASAANAFSFSDITSLFPRINPPKAFPSAAPQPRPSPSAAPGSSKNGSGSGDVCDKWTPVTQELHQKFLTGGQCNDFARQAVRAAFHDCGTYTPSLGTSAGCDGSFVLAQEYNNQENLGLAQIGQYYEQILSKYKGIGAADLIQMAASTAVLTCPLGPTVQTYVGRPDRHTANPTGILPSPFDGAEKTIALFQGYGVKPDLFVALLGAHSTSTQKFVDPSKAGAPQDTTPGTWDVAYYGETLKKDKSIFTFQSDLSVANNSVTAPTFKAFVNNQAGWNTAFVEGMTQLSLVGVPGGSGSLTDCTKALPAGTNKRNVKAAPINARSI